MKTWLELEVRFRQLLNPLQDLRLDHQTGPAGEIWNLTGLQRGEAYRECELLCGVAGRLLERALDETVDPGRSLLAEEDPKLRWFRAVKELSGQYRTNTFAGELDEDGNTVGRIYAGTVQSFVANAANLCLLLEAEYPMKDPRPFWERLYDDYGKHIVVGTILAVITAIIGLAFG